MAEQVFQIGVKGLVTNSEGKILLVGRRGKDQNDRPHLDLPGGRIDGSESVLDALKRELQEEIGVTEYQVDGLYDALISNITIPVGDIKVPLALVIYKVIIPVEFTVVLGHEEELFDWFSPAEAAKHLVFKYPDYFVTKIASL